MIGISHLLFLLWAGVTVSSLDLHKRIDGGHECEPRDRHYHVKLTVNTGQDLSLCGGSLISDRWVLTAAHCWTQGRTMTAYFAVHPRLGQKPTEIQITDEPQIYTDDSGSHDIMLLHLPKAIRIEPVALPDCGNRPDIGATVRVAGHGRRDAVPHELRDLNCLDVKIVNCQEMTDTLQSTNNQNGLCYQGAGVDMCPGDSGGGVVYNKMIYGVHAFSGGNACSPAAMFIDVCAYEEWIKTTIKP